MADYKFTELDKCFDYIRSVEISHIKRISILENIVKDSVSLCTIFRNNKIFEPADKLREILSSNGIKISQTKNGVSNYTNIRKELIPYNSPIGTIYQPSNILDYLNTFLHNVVKVRKLYNNIINGIISCYRHYYNLGEYECARNIEYVLMDNNIEIIYGTCRFGGWENIPHDQIGELGNDTFIEVIE